MKKMLKSLSLPIFGIIISCLLIFAGPLLGSSTVLGNGKEITTVSASHKPSFGDGSGLNAENPFLIDSAETLNATATRNLLGTANRHFMLISNIDLGSYSNWTPIATLASGCVFDGNDYKIDNLKITSNSTNAGLFGKLAGATVKNLSMNNVNCTTSTYNTGALAGVVSGGTSTLEYIKIESGTIKGTAAGGILGEVQTSGTVVNISKCYNKASVTSTSYFTGGIVGRANSSSIVNISLSYNAGLITGGSNCYTGGMVGLVGDSGATVNINNCFNTGNVYAGSASTSNGAGGLIGTIWSSGNKATITNSYSIGAITGVASSNQGGIIGNINGGTLTLNNVRYNIDTFSGNICGRVSSGSYSGQNYSSYTTQQLKSSDFLNSLGDNYINGPDGYPTLKAFLTAVNIIFDYNDESGQIDIITQEIGSDVIIPIISKTGYNFEGWYINPEGTGLEITSITAASDVTLYAKWTLTKYFVTFDTTSGDWDSDQQNPFVSLNQTNVISAEGPSNFANWQVLKAEGVASNPSDWVNVPGGQNLNLKDIIDADFIDNYARTTAITPQSPDGLEFVFRAIFKTTSPVTFDSQTRSYGYVQLDGFNIQYDKEYRYGAVNPDDNFMITVIPNTHYEFSHIITSTWNDSLGIWENETIRTYAGSGVAGNENFSTPDSVTGKTSMPYNLGGAKVKVEVFFKQKIYSLELKFVDMSGNDISAHVASLFEINNVATTTANFSIHNFPPQTISLTSLIHQDGNVRYRFVNYSVNSIWGLETYAGFGGSVSFPNSLLYSHHLFSNQDGYQVGANGKLVVTVQFIVQNLVTVNLDSANGTFQVGYYENGILIPVDNPATGFFCNIGSQVVLYIYPNNNYKVSDITLNNTSGLVALGGQVSFYMYEETDIVIFFDIATYKVVIDNEDTQKTQIPLSNELDKSIDEVKLGALATELIVYKDDTSVSSHQFDGWFIKVGTTYTDISTLDTSIAVTTDDTVTFYEILDEFLSSDGSFVIIARYIELLTVEIELPEEFVGIFGGGEGYTIEVDNVEKTNTVDNRYRVPYGSTVVVMAKDDARYYFFAGFDSLETGDFEDGLTLTATIEFNRSIIMFYTFKTFTIINNSNTTDAVGKLTSETKFELGKTIVITFNPNTGYEIRNFIMSVTGVNTNTLINAGYLKIRNGIATLKADEAWLDLVNLDNDTLLINTKVETTLNTTYIAMLLGAAVLIPVLLVGIILYVFAIRRKKTDYLKALERSKQMKAGFDQADLIRSLKQN